MVIQKFTREINQNKSFDVEKVCQDNVEPKLLRIQEFICLGAKLWSLSCHILRWYFITNDIIHKCGPDAIGLTQKFLTIEISFWFKKGP